MFRPLIILVLTVLLPSPTVFAAEKQVLRLGLPGGTDSVREFAPLITHLDQSESYRFEISLFEDDDALIRVFRDSIVDLALISPVRYVEVHRESGAVPIIAEGGMLRSVIVVQRTSSVQSAGDLKDGSLALGPEGSIASHLIPLRLLAAHSVNPSDLHIEHTGQDQEAIVEAVLSGSVIAGGISEPIFDRHREELRAIVISEPFPGPTLISPKGTNPKVIEAVRKLFLSYKPVEGQRFSGGAIAVTDGDFAGVRHLAEPPPAKLDVKPPSP